MALTRDTSAPWAEPVPEAPYPLTAAELATLPAYERRYELVKGRLVRMPPTSGWHGRISMDLGTILNIFVKMHQLGVIVGAETGFLISRPDAPDTVLAPDIAFIRAELLPTLDSSAWNTFLHLAPDLVVEIASPSQYHPEMADKAHQWLDAGTRLVWIVWPNARQIDVWQTDRSTHITLDQHATLEGSDVLPGFACPVADIFPNEPLAKG